MESPLRPKRTYAKGLVYKRGCNGEPLLLGAIRSQHDESRPGEMDVFGGRCRDGEDPLDALYREFEEEAGITAADFVDPPRWFWGNDELQERPQPQGANLVIPVAHEYFIGRVPTVYEVKQERLTEHSYAFFLPPGALRELVKPPSMQEAIGYAMRNGFLV